MYGVWTRLTPQANFNPITPCCTNPNLTPLNMAVQIVNLIMYQGHVLSDRLNDEQTKSSIGPSFQSGAIKNSSIAPPPPLFQRQAIDK